MEKNLAVVIGALWTAALVAGDGDGGGGGSKLMQPLKLSCSTGSSSKYGDGSQYRKNLDRLLAAIPMAAAGNGGFYNGTFGAVPDKVFGLFMCYAAGHGHRENHDHDVCRACQECLATAPAAIMRLCPGSRAARAIYDACVVRYSDVSFFSVAGDLGASSFYVQRRAHAQTAGDSLWEASSEAPYVVDAAAMNLTRSELMASLAASAAHSPLRLAITSTLFGGYPWMYSRRMQGLAQCTMDLPASECTRCLSGYAARLPRLFPNGSSGAIKGYSCFVMYAVVTPVPPAVRLPSERALQEEALFSGRTKRRRRLLVAAVVAVVLVICLGLSAWYLLHRRRRRRTMAKAAIIPKSELEQPLKYELKQGTWPRRFSYGELAAATGQFSGDNKLGEGGFGSVYRGVLTTMNDLPVAVKKVSKSSKQGWKEFVSEVSIISRLRHRNLVQLIGWCHDKDDGDELLLVYELMPNGSLDDRIYSAGNVMPWPVRYEVVLGVGAALLYLHEETTEQCVLHRDIKPSNVMLDASFNAKLGDFGLARLVGDGRRSRTTGAAGTLGYMDPECVCALTASVESDVYSFGVLLLEVACGRRPAVPSGDGGVVHLAQWIWEWHGGGAILEAADARLDGEFDGQEMERVLAVGLWCAHPNRALRPSVRQAVRVLRFEAPLPAVPARMPVATYTTPPAAADSAGTAGDDNTSSTCSISIET